MATKVPPKRGDAFAFTLPGLISQADANVFITNPTIAAGDFTISKDGGNPASLTSTPTVINAGTMVRVSLSAAEMTCDDFAIAWEDQAGAQWQSGGAVGFTVTANQIDDLATAAALATVDTVVDAILADTGIDGVVVAAASKTGYALSAAGVDGILDEAVEGAYTMRQLLRLLAAALGGEASGGGTATITFRDLGDTKDRIEMAVDANGNRSTVTLDLT